MKLSIKIWLIIGALVAGSGASLLIYQNSYNQQTKGLYEAQQNILNDYGTKISKRSDVYQLTLNGLKQLDHKMPDIALVTLKRATDADKNYRDGWIALGLAEMANNDTDLAIQSLKIAETIDPINPKTYEYLKLAYEKLEKSDLALQAQNKYDYLTKTR